MQVDLTACARRHRTTALALTIITACFLFLSAPFLLAEPPAQKRERIRHADLVISNARLWTGSEPAVAGNADPEQLAAIAISGGTIAAIGEETSLGIFYGSKIRAIDAGGRRVIPGITDSHAHLIGGGLQLTRLHLRDVGSREEFTSAVARRAKTVNQGEWVLGGRWSVESWDKPQSPCKEWIDPVTGKTPVYLTRMDGHQALVNSAALKLAGIDASGPQDPVGGEIERNPQTGEPTGILRESAKDLVKGLIPEPSLAQRYAALKRAMEHANSLGITSVHYLVAPEDMEVLERAHNDGTLTVRITAYLEDEDWTAHFTDVAQSDLKHDMVRLAGLKGYMDGSLGSRTAYMRKPYSDAPQGTPYPHGQLTAFAQSRESFHSQVQKADALGLQMAVHAIGDEANHLLLDAYEAALKHSNRRASGHRIEHAQHLLVEDIPRFAKLGVVASMQPFHKADDGRYAERRLGKKRLAGSYAFRQLVDCGALVCFGSDWPVVTMNPFAGIDSAVNAKTLAGDVWLPEHSLTLDEAMRAYTVSPQKAVHQEGRLGTLEVGKLADLVILEDDPLSAAPDQLAKTRVAYTIVGGKIVYSRGGPVTGVPPLDRSYHNQGNVVGSMATGG
ncbi:MAG: amidohydrolase [Phycisphaerales bacterium]|nr:MAG: amidohydrolase [Phycisphaerales bacterium]